MDKIILIKGKVKFPITLDPSVWIFDDRKKELDAIFGNENETETNIGFKDKQEEYTEAISQNWEREIMEGAILPPTLKTEKTYLKEKLLTGNYCMPLGPFLDNAEIDPNAKHLIIETAEGDISLTLNEGKELILLFSKDGKPLKDDGPVHCYLRDGSNIKKPIKNVKAFRVE